VDDRFFHAFLPPTAKVCGVELERFSLWHHLTLSAINSPVALGGEFITVPDLLVAVKVCALKYGESNVKASIRDIYWRIKLSRNPKLFRREVEKLYDWIGLQSSPPKFYKGGSDGSVNKGVESGARCLGLACSLMKRGGMSEAEAWNCTLGKAMWLDAQFAQLDGLELRFLDDEDIDESEIDLSNLTDDEAMNKFKSELPDELVLATFDHWKSKIKKGGKL